MPYIIIYEVRHYRGLPSYVNSNFTHKTWALGYPMVTKRFCFPHHNECTNLFLSVAKEEPFGFPQLTAIRLYSLIRGGGLKLNLPSTNLIFRFSEIYKNKGGDVVAIGFYSCVNRGVNLFLLKGKSHELKEND